MKWAKMKPSVHDKARRQEDDDACYRYYTHEEIKESFESNKKNLWVKHSFEFNFSSKEHYERFQKRYEIFCGGYLYFYDKVTRNNTTDHAIYFKWKPFNEKGNYFVTIYMDPVPGRLSDKNTHHEGGDQYHGKEMEHEKEHHYDPKTAADKKLLPKENGMTVQANIAAPVALNVMSFDTALDPAIDPPPPPAPPPPDRQE